MPRHVPNACLLMLSLVCAVGCSQQHPEDHAEVEADSMHAEVDADSMHAEVDADSMHAAVGGPETRCGWFSNPTPGNAWLDDRDGTWTVGMQGGHQAEGDWPIFGEDEWVEVNRSYGYGCACLTVAANPETREVVNILSAESRPLSACRSDAALSDWESQQ